MPSKTILEITTDELIANTNDQLAAPDKEQFFFNLMNYLRRVQSSIMPATLGISSASQSDVTLVAATATITSTGSAANNETMKLCNQTLTAKTSGAVAASGEFNISGTVGTQAASIALAINSVPALAGVVTAEAVAGVVTVTAVVPGVAGNGLECADVDLANVAVAGFSGGSGVVPAVYLDLLDGDLTTYKYNRA